MQIHSDRFETTIPKRSFSFTTTKPPTKLEPKPWLGSLILGGIAGMALMAMIHQPSPSPAGTSPAPTVAATPSPLPDPKPVRAMPAPVISAPRAQLLHIRPIGAFENDTMPDGRVLGTTYKGELQSAMQLPRMGAQPGDMWYTRNDGHCWVLAPVYAGSQTMAWVDP